MIQLHVKQTLQWEPILSERVRQVIRLFGVRLSRLRQSRLEQSCKLELEPGQIVFITGAGGAGKTSLLEALYRQVPRSRRLRLERIAVERGKSLIDCMGADLPDALQTLSRAGLSDVFCMLQEPARLSEGQKARYRLARALMSSKRFIFADEFTASMDRITAAVVAHNLRKAAARSGKIFVLASCHEDILPDLQPDVLIIKYLSGRTDTIFKNRSGRKR